MKAIKKFLEWIRLKESIHNSQHKSPLFAEREVWMCHTGENIGFESNGKNDFFHRPVIILHKFNENIFYGLPMSTKLKNNPFYIEINFKERKQSAMISQMRILDAKRLHYKKGRLSNKDFNLVKLKFLEIF